MKQGRQSWFTGVLIAFCLLAIVSCNTNSPRLGLLEVNPSVSVDGIEAQGGKWVKEDVPIMQIDTTVQLGSFSYEFYYQFSTYEDKHPTSKFWRVSVYDTTAFVAFVENNARHIIMQESIIWKPKQDIYSRAIWKDIDGRQFRIDVYDIVDNYYDMTINYRFEE